MSKISGDVESIMSMRITAIVYSRGKKCIGKGFSREDSKQLI
ncbi:MAG: hypothetical protein QXS79_02605 [Candidatus Bathyarchaeia archaeon]